MSGCHIRRAIRKGHGNDTPYPHWLLHNVLPTDLANAVTALPFDAPAIDDTNGRRETHNSSRIFVSETNRARHSACEALAENFQDEAAIALLEDVGGRPSPAAHCASNAASTPTVSGWNHTPTSVPSASPCLSIRPTTRTPRTEVPTSTTTRSI
jgi:hypothetical protein